MSKYGHKFIATAGHQFDLLLQNETDKFLCVIGSALSKEKQE